MSKSIPAFLIASTKSGGGKTTVTLGLLAALKRRGLNIQPFKCGPDFIDPTLHAMVSGKTSRNLDPRMCGDDYTRRAFARTAPHDGISVVEGVMGLFDGAEGSAAHLAKLLDLPVILVVDARSAAQSVAAVVLGFETLDPRVRVAGVILNQVSSERHYQLIAEALRAHCRARLLGALPRKDEIAIPSRHLGLRMGGEEPLEREAREKLADLLEQHCDLDLLLSLAGDRVHPEPDPLPPRPPVVEPGAARIAVAMDEAFCFYYRDNLDMLRDAGAQLLPFSPLRDQQLPPQINGVYLGGGYPELFAEQLSDNRPMREAINQWSLAGKPLYAECGGFMYLTGGIAGTDMPLKPMAGIFPTTAHMRERLGRLGYCRAEQTRSTLFGGPGTILRGHEFHYSDIEPMGPGPVCCYQLDDGRAEGYLLRNTLAGYPHLHWGGGPRAAENLVLTCAVTG